MSLLNKEIYTMNRDKLIYDSKHPIDAIVVEVDLSVSEAGAIMRGQVLDFDDASGKYSVHADKGTPSVIVAVTNEYEADDTSIPVEVYVSGTFRKSEIISDPVLTDADVDALRGKSIYLK